MILLTAMTPSGQRLGMKVGARVVLIEALDGGAKPLPRTLEEALLKPGALDQLEELQSKQLRSSALDQLGAPLEKYRLGALFRPRNLLCIGLNYKDHAAEGGVPIPKEPVVFAKLTGCVIGPNEPIVLPPGTEEVDYEAELAVVIGRRCRGVSKAEALQYAAGYTCMNDVSARDFQRSDGQWVRAKSQDTFGPMGPYLVTREEIPDPQQLAISCTVNGTRLQDSNTNKMIFGVAELVAFISRGITLEPGDVISTGTPHGVGFARKPPVFLKAGDEVVVEIERIGKLLNPVRAGL